ncbi:hypothetical protein SAMN04487968_105141 [Nocardioides terrae]|uniref:Uncharacterized protein n=1 Tax=Nocardioides terrae TaxID=574651 RepID=A0A1I1I5B2_9ACTN|nr:hypothetical protein [Nocardioides terrae]SFC31507.1 hypothetical protein SAMN04487968_105141 [Nocardioides terrae]
MLVDRRKPVARYVLFADPATQERFADVAEAAYQDLARVDQWSGTASLTLPAAPSEDTETKRRGLRRRAVEHVAAAEVLTVTGALSAAGEAARDLPDRVVGLGGCAAERKLAATLGRVVLELVRDLAGVPLDDQRLHPAYGQTLRLAGELQALHTMLVAAPCPDPFGCVRARQPEQWGRRTEDVEIAEVRAVLLELAAEDEG